MESTLTKCIRGPRLKRLFYVGRDINGTPYTPNKLERYADCVLLAASFLVSFAYHITPVYATYYVIRYGIPSLTGVISSLKGLSFIPLSVTIAYVARGIGRYKNEHYREFLRSLDLVHKLQTTVGPSEARSTGIHQYDFEMFSYPVTFRHDESTVRPRRLSSHCRKSLLEKIRDLPLTSLRYIGAYVVGRRMIYPGSNGIFNLLLGEPLSIGRAKLRRRYDGYRAKLLASDGNHIDSMFVDKRGSPDSSARGNKLVICCEGNAGYYEVGIMDLALQGGYSALGWNHPGFGESTGLPFPDQEFNAIDVVIRYAVSRLGFAFEDIILFGWSIGGYTTTCGAMSYPDVAGQILDATFDELFPLVKTRCPNLLENLAKGMVQDYFNLNIADQACCYSGPISIIRRQQDEMMTTRLGDLSSNRANYLLIRLLQTRYPNLSTPEGIRALWKWLSTDNQDMVMKEFGVNSSYCKACLSQYMNESGEEFPWLIGDKLPLQEKTRLLLYLASQYMLTYHSSHCQPLPFEMVQLPSSRGNFRT